MILPGMTYPELINEVSKDSEKLIDIMFREVLKIRKPKILRDRYPDGKTLPTATYRSKVTGNKYYIQPRAKYDPTQKISKLAATANIFTQTYDSQGKMIWMKVPLYNEDFYRKMRLYGENPESSNLIEAYIYTPHFLKRYNERFLKGNEEEDMIKILETYLSRNSTRIFSHTEGKWKYENEDRIGYEMRVSDGVELGMIVRDGIFQANTFISDEMLREDQNCLLGKSGYLWETYMDI